MDYEIDVYSQPANTEAEIKHYIELIFKAVLEMALRDAKLIIAINRDNKITPRMQEKIDRKAEALNFFRNCEKDFNIVCEIAGYNPEYVKETCVNKILQAELSTPQI